MAEPKPVLIVDDEPGVRASIARVVQRRGFEALLAENGREALGVLAERPEIELVFIDAQMPILDGFDTIEQARAEHGTELHVVMVTGLRGDEDVMRGYDRGADYYLPKPFRPEKLNDLLRYFLDPLSEEERERVELRL